PILPSRHRRRDRTSLRSMGAPMKAMVLAAGLGTRLGGLSDECPKPLLPVVDVPLIRYSLALLAGHGVTDVIVNTHHLAPLFVTELGRAVTYSHEPEILGTGGALRKAARFFDDGPFFLLNGKIIIDVDLDDLARHHAACGAIATLVVRADDDAKRWRA